MYEQLLALRCDNRAAAAASGLPAAHYTDPAHFELEKRRIFYRSWICVGHECMAEMERRTGIEVIHTHGEKPAAYIADGYARVSGRPGVCMAQQVDALNLAAGLRDAHLASSPVIAMTGGSPPQ